MNVQEVTSPGRPLPPPTAAGHRVPDPRKPRSKAISPEQRLIFAASIQAGETQAVASQRAGISRQSGVKLFQEVKRSGEAGKKDSLIQSIQVRLASPSTPPQYWTPMAALLADLQGWKRGKDEAQQLLPMATLFDAWRAETLGAQGLPIDTNNPQVS